MAREVELVGGPCDGMVLALDADTIGARLRHTESGDRAVYRLGTRDRRGRARYFYDAPESRRANAGTRGLTPDRRGG